MYMALLYAEIVKMTTEIVKLSYRWNNLAEGFEGLALGFCEFGSPFWEESINFVGE